MLHKGTRQPITTSLQLESSQPPPPPPRLTAAVPTEKPPVDPQLENGPCQTSSVFGPVDARPDTSYPEGGRTATVVLLGSFCALAGGLGLMNSMGRLRHVGSAPTSSRPRPAQAASPGSLASTTSPSSSAGCRSAPSLTPAAGLMAAALLLLQRRRLCRPRLNTWHKEETTRPNLRI
ncbi:hypothetical protein MY11210_001088 [Beauveria gryllotalpidicola]